MHPTQRTQRPQRERGRMMPGHSAALLFLLVLVSARASGLAAAAKASARPRSDPDSDSGQASAAADDRAHRCANAKDQESGDLLRAAARQCMADKRLLLIGNSVTRHWLSLLSDLLVGRFFDMHRDFAEELLQEKLKCGNGQMHLEGQLCTAELGNTSTTQIDYVWQHKLFSQNLVDQLATPIDVVIANLGLSDIYFAKSNAMWEKPLIDKAVKLADALESLPASTYVYWRTTTRLCVNTKENKERFPQMNKRLAVSNAHVVSLLSPLPNVHIFDAWEATQDCREFSDHVHHPQAAIDHVLIFLSRYCGPELGRLALDMCPHLGPQYDGKGKVRPRPCVARRAERTAENTLRQQPILNPGESLC